MSENDKLFKKICICTPLRGGHFGDTVRIVELFSRIPRLLDNSHFYFFTSRKYKFCNLENITFINVHALLFGKEVRYFSRFISNLITLFIALLMPWDLVYEIQTTTPGMGFLLSRVKRIPLVYEVNSILEYEKERNFFNNLLILIAKKMESLTVNAAEKITVVTKELKIIFHEEYKIPLDKIEVVPNGANIEILDLMNTQTCRKKLNLNQNASIVGFVGGLGKGCGAKGIIKSARYVIKELPDVLFLIVGDGPYKSMMEQKIEESGLKEYFIFTGAISRENISLYINSFDVCIAMYSLDERIKKIGLSPVKIYEYMACGRPVISSKYINGIEIVHNSNSGILVDVNNPFEIAEAIVKILKAPKLGKEMGENGRKLVENGYNWEFFAKKVSNILEETLQNNSHSIRT